MDKIAIFVVMLVTVAVFSGCLGGTADKTEQKIKTDDGDVKVKTETQSDGKTTTYEQTIESDEGAETIKVTAVSGTEGWCEEGAEWNMQTAGPGVAGGDASVNAKIDKVMTSGKYAGLCHVEYSDGTTNIDYYFDESEKNGFIVMDVNGQKIEQVWHG